VHCRDFANRSGGDVARARESPYSFPSPALRVAGVAPATRQGKIVMRELTDPGRPLLTAVIAPEGLGA
jgi:hypothetical protein